MKLQSFCALILILFLVSCEKERVDIKLTSGDELFIGYWKDYDHTDSSRVLKRTASLAGDRYAFAILSDGTFLENKNAGPCATPPIYYSVFEGNWQEKQDDTLLINTQFLGGETQIQMVILNVSEYSLEVKSETISREDSGL